MGSASLSPVGGRCDPEVVCPHVPHLPPPLQPSPSRREDRPVSFYQLGSSATSVAKDKQRGFAPSIVQNETYGAVLSGGPAPGPPSAPGAPPLPPRNVAKGTEPGARPCAQLWLGCGWEASRRCWAPHQGTSGPFGVAASLGPFVCRSGVCFLRKRRHPSVGAAHGGAS